MVDVHCISILSLGNVGKSDVKLTFSRSGKECSNYTIQITELNNTNETAQQESAISNSSEYSLLTSTPMHESTDNATVRFVEHLVD